MTSFVRRPALFLALAFALLPPLARASTTSTLQLPAPAASDIDLSPLTPEEREVYGRGHFGTGRVMAGGLLGTVVGFGSGHLVYGMWKSRGWVFTAGEAASLAVMFTGASRALKDPCYLTSDLHFTSSCYHPRGERLIQIGALALLTFRVIEAIDAWSIPASQNEKFENLNERLVQARAKPYWTLYPTVLPTDDHGGHVVGLEFQVSL